MKLHKNQLKLICHLAQFNLLDYPHCLEFLKTEEVSDRVGLSYAFRPLTKNGYLARCGDGMVSILAKGRSLFPDTKPLITTGGGGRGAERVIEISRMAALMEKNGILVAAKPPQEDKVCFIPSACWRNIAPGILSTTRFVGMLIGEGQKLTVYDIGDGRIDSLPIRLPAC